MKIIAMGDTHGTQYWKQIVNKEIFDKIVFIGDYFDSFDVKPEDQINNFLDIIEFKDKSDKEVILLIGNHDHHYFPDIGPSGTSGYQENWAFVIGEVLEKNRSKLQMAYQHENIVFTHAGITPIWFNITMGDEWELEEGQTYADAVNEIWKYKPKAFMFNGRDPYGNDKYQTPIWIRPQALMYSGMALKREIIQVVGHTAQEKIDIQGKSTGGRYYFIDTLQTSHEYLIIENGKFKTGKYE